MSISVHFQAVIPVDSDTYRKHKAVVDACEAAGVSIPAETAAFFDDDDCEREVTEQGVRISVGRWSRRKAVEGDALYGEGAVIDLSKLPPGTTKIRIYSS